MPKNVLEQLLKFVTVGQWWASYLYKVTELLYFRFWQKKQATFNLLPISLVSIPSQFLVTGILNVTKLLLVNTKGN
jgi:hypothetical protein